MEVKNKELENLIEQYTKPEVKEVKKVEFKEKRMFDFEKEDVRRGIILSEILGPPKGRIK